MGADPWSGLGFRLHIKAIVPTAASSAAPSTPPTAPPITPELSLLASLDCAAPAGAVTVAVTVVVAVNDASLVSAVADAEGKSPTSTFCIKAV